MHCPPPCIHLVASRYWQRECDHLQSLLAHGDDNTKLGRHSMFEVIPRRHDDINMS